MLTLTATIKALRPSDAETPASGGQLAFLYMAIAFYAVGTGGTRYTTMTMGADQFTKVEDQDVFFNWFFIVVYGVLAIGGTAVVYIEDSISWELGFGICLAVNALALLCLLLGAKYYRRPVPEGSPFTALARVAVASFRKRKLALPPPTAESAAAAYYHGPSERADQPPSSSFSYMNRAALIVRGDVKEDGSIARPWSLCTVQEVENPKTLIRIIPLWTSTIFISVCIATQTGLSILQAITMNRHLCSDISIPAGSFVVSTLVATCLTLFILDRAIYPLCHRLIGHTPTPLQRVGIGQIFNIAAMVASALVEHRRATIIKQHNAANQPDWIVPMSAFWLVLPNTLTGIGEAFHFPGQIAFYYQEFPKSLKNTATGMIAVILSLGFYISTVVVALVQRATNWLPDNLNSARLDNVYWMLAVMASINFAYYGLCSKLYKKQRIKLVVVDANTDEY
ncbi:hypothetical protein J5N97_014737 [Dioscorea zingiberensis]|uniref:Uncharacterized protein n=1 Tax=Dioscorea zingiberensis TaxID=325984 RepID=A0A9D5HK21_9LILI|nr:hypothetical protein J5N97_014737 [Dioscorea zingiberensis]